jgi:hypothetical protein
LLIAIALESLVVKFELDRSQAQIGQSPDLAQVLAIAAFRILRTSATARWNRFAAFSIERPAARASRTTSGSAIAF